MHLIPAQHAKPFFTATQRNPPRASETDGGSAPSAARAPSGASRPSAKLCRACEGGLAPYDVSEDFVPEFDCGGEG